ncbi:MFS general substrate transporter [Trichoderma sp. SZMC 28014]
MSQVEKNIGEALELEQARSALTYNDEKTEKPVSTVYIPDHAGSHNKSKEERRLVLKIDCLIVPLSALLYFVAYLDRNSIGNAAILGMKIDLGLTQYQWSTCLSMFFVGYIILLLPGNVLLGKLRPNLQLGGTALAFGALLAIMSAAQNYATVLSLRVLIGGTQAFMQGLSVYFTLWYKRDELATRGAFVYLAATISGAFSGLIAYGVGISLTADTTGRTSWRWLFIIEGSMAMAVGLAICLLLPQSPDKLKRKHWLFASADIEIAKGRSASYNTVGFGIKFEQIWIALLDPKAWAFAVINAGLGLGISSVGLFLPTFIKALGFSVERTQLFSVIPYACAAFVLPISIYSDHINRKGPFLIFTLALSCIGYIVLLNNVSKAGKIVAACIITSGLYPSVVILQAWLTGNMAGFTKRATSWAMAEIFSQVFSIMGSYVYDSPPRFIKGHAIVLGFLLTAILMCVFLTWWMRRENARKEVELGKHESEGTVHPHKTRSLEEEQDRHVDFRYVL